VCIWTIARGFKIRVVGVFSSLLFSLGLFHGLEDDRCIRAKGMEAKGAFMFFLFFCFE